MKKYLVSLLLASILLLSCGGDGGEQVGTTTTLSQEIVLNQPSQIIQFENTGRVGGEKEHVLKFRVQPLDYFRCADGHVGIMTRATLEAIPTGQYRGVGWILGRFGTDSYTTRNLPEGLPPLSVIETWAVGAVPENTFDSLLVNTVSISWVDGGTYDVTLRTSQAAPNTVGYTVTREGHSMGYASGDVVDTNPAVDMNRQALAFFNTASANPKCPYSVVFTNVTSTWK